MTDAATSAARLLRVRLLIAAIAMVGIIADRLTKWWALTHLREGRPVSHWNGFLTWNLLFNSGAAFSMGSNATVVFSVLGLVVLAAGVVYLAPRVRQYSTAVLTGLGLAGVAGNVIDRLIRPPGPLRGEVVDFIQLPYWAVFNVADMLLTTVMVLMVGSALVGLVQQREDAHDVASSVPAASGQEAVPPPAGPAGADDDTAGGTSGEPRR